MQTERIKVKEFISTLTGDHSTDAHICRSLLRAIAAESDPAQIQSEALSLLQKAVPPDDWQTEFSIYKQATRRALDALKDCPNRAALLREAQQQAEALATAMKTLTIATVTEAFSQLTPREKAFCQLTLKLTRAGVKLNMDLDDAIINATQIGVSINSSENTKLGNLWRAASAVLQGEEA